MGLRGPAGVCTLGQTAAAMRRLLPLLVLVSGCRLFWNGDSDEPPRACTMEFRMFDVTVLDASGAPVQNARIDVRRGASGASIVCPDASEQAGCVVPGSGAGFDGQGNGRYLVMSDGVEVQRGGERFTVQAARDGQQAEAVLGFRHDGCHVQKTAGPDTLTLR